jgi:hypothetical protein
MIFWIFSLLGFVVASALKPLLLVQIMTVLALVSAGVFLQKKLVENLTQTESFRSVKVSIDD